MAHNQELLRLSKSKNQNHSTSLIQLASQNVPFADESGTFIITVANASDIVEITKKPNGEDLIGAINEGTSVKPSTIDIEQEFDELASNDIAAEIRVDSENEDGYNEDGDEDDNGDEDSPSSIVDSPHVQYKKFPTEILDGCKLLYKGHDLLNMISRFYRLECDQCE